MSKPKLIDIIKENAEKLSTEILDKARTEAGTILEKATRSSEDLRKKARLKVQAEADHIQERKYNMYRFRTNARRYELKSSAIKSIWREAGEILSKIEHSEKHKNILQSLFFECIDSIPDGSIVRTSPEDAEIIRTCVDRSARPLVFEEDSQVCGGVEFHWPDGKIVLKNTLSYRLSRLKAEGNAELSKILFSSAEGSSP